MAEVVGYGRVGNDKYWLHTWESLANGDTGRPVRKSALADKTVSVDGTFSVGGEVTIKGSHDGTTWFTVTDPQGNAVVFTGAGVLLISENPRFIMPDVTGGDGSTSVNVRLGASAGL